MPAESRWAIVPTIRDVALAAKVAIGTVSRVLNGHKSVSDDVRRRVLKAIKKLKYEPDRVAQSMRLGVTRTVAFATRDISIPGFGAIVNAAEEVLRSSGYTLLLAITDERKERELDLLRIFQQRRVDAVIMTTSSEDDAELCRADQAVDIPIVLLDRENPARARRGHPRSSARHPRCDRASASGSGIPASRC